MLAAAASLVSCTTRPHPPAGAGDPVTPPPAQPPEATPAPFTRACPGLPRELPDDLVVRFARHDYERPENLVRFSLVSDARPCPPDDMAPHLLRTYRGETCLRVEVETMRALYAELLGHGVDAIRTRPMEPGPHRGGVELRFVWGDASCRVSSVWNDTEVDERDQPAFRQVDGAIRAAVRGAR